MAKTAKPVDIATPLRTSTVDQVQAQHDIPAYSQSQLQKIDLRKPSGLTASDLKLVTSAGLVGLEEAFVSAEKKYGVNCLFLMSIASEESAKGTMMFRKNNMFGFGRSGFSSKAEGIHVVANTLSKKYLNPGGSLYGGSPTIGGVRKRYCTSTAWTGKVARYMATYYSTIDQHRDNALDKLD
jgi:beta-N-acetylglucosaminidase